MFLRVGLFKSLFFREKFQWGVPEIFFSGSNYTVYFLGGCNLEERCFSDRLKAFQDFFSEELGGHIVLDREESYSFDFPHYLAVGMQTKRESKDSDPSSIWLDGCNVFNPYRISEIARNSSIEPESALQDVYVSRAFTCYQMSSLILEKMWNALKKYSPELVVITGLPSIFLESDISASEAERVFQPVLEELKRFKNRSEVLFLTSKTSTKINNSNIFSETVEISDEVLIAKEDQKGDVKIEKDTSDYSETSIFTISENESPSPHPTLDDYSEG